MVLSHPAFKLRGKGKSDDVLFGMIRRSLGFRLSEESREEADEGQAGDLELAGCVGLTAGGGAGCASG